MSANKIGEGHASAMGRKGMTEIAQYLTAFNNAGTQVIEDQGVWPNKTPGEIAESRGGDGKGPEQESKQSLDEFRASAKENATKEQTKQKEPEIER